MYRSWFTPLARIAAPLALATMAACGSDSSTGTTTGLTTSQKTALNNLLNNQSVSDAIAGSGEAGAFVGLGLSEGGTLGLNSIGTVNFSGTSANRLVPTGKLVLSPRTTTITGPTGTFQAFGAQLVLHYVQTPDTLHAVWTGFIAVNSLDNPTALLSAGVVRISNVVPTSIASTDIATPTDSVIAMASYMTISGQTVTVYPATSGQVAISSASFPGSTACPSAYLQAPLLACSYASGTIAGSFNFTGMDNAENTVTIPSTTFSVPASQTTVTIDGTQSQ